MIEVSEDVLPGTVIGAVTATDRDSGDFGKVSYFLDGRTATRGLFTVNQDTGQIVVQSPLDRETQASDTRNQFFKRLSGNMSLFLCRNLTRWSSWLMTTTGSDSPLATPSRPLSKSRSLSRTSTTRHPFSRTSRRMGIAALSSQSSTVKGTTVKSTFHKQKVPQKHLERHFPPEQTFILKRDMVHYM